VGAIAEENIDFDGVRGAFIEAHRIKAKDTNVALALGVLSFI